MIDDSLYIISKIKNGDIKAFEDLFKRYYVPLYKYSFFIIGNIYAAEEVVEDLFYRIWKNRTELPIIFSCKNYLFGAVKNRSLDYLKHNKIKDKYLNIKKEEENISQLDPVRELEYKDLMNILNKVLITLPPKQRLIFEMQRFKGLKYEEIAKELNISVKTVEANITKTLKMLREKIEWKTSQK